MAQQQTQFTYKNIRLYKSESLGSGSYGGVCKAKCDGLLCAAKIMHSTLFDLHDPGAASYLHKFQEECHLLSLARHPNVVQYLSTYYDPDTQLPVLLMELGDESLTAFLERSPGPLSYHFQLNICLDIALALVYLHSNGLIHRDLTGNNVLMIGTRAKITDFGMSKFATGNPALTLCPGNLLYMPPEALDETKTYTSKLDIFSFGVIVIQILTRQFPKPTDRVRKVDVPQLRDKEMCELVPETERRQEHLQLISDDHSLKPLALECLNKIQTIRPSALQLSERLSELKQAPQYTESMHQPQKSSEIQQLEQQLRDQRILIDQLLKEKQPKQLPVTEGETAHKGISKITWREGKEAPERMSRGAAVVDGNTAYFRPAISARVFSYQNTEQWSRLPDNPNENFSLAVIDCLLTSVGGWNKFNYSPTNTLLSLTGEGERKQWSEKFPPMPTPRKSSSCITTEQAIVVAGGNGGDVIDLATVEVMDINTKEWMTVCSLPQKQRALSGIVCGESIYLAGGYTGQYKMSKSVFTCSLSDLWKFGSKWREISNLPVTRSTLASFNGHLLAIGGKDDSQNPTNDVYRYDSHTDTWQVISQMKNKRSMCFTVTLPENQLIVVGGYKDIYTIIRNVEIMHDK